MSGTYAKTSELIVLKATIYLENSMVGQHEFRERTPAQLAHVALEWVKKMLGSEASKPSAH